ncbi:conserved hypothetical protein [Leishmania braziliensis MHOM/BR/75/M2904]|uniref:Uncharacterized protein n=2 Tax=Leishmania braziliensis TaxID=5660 RepID=A4HAV5_LEIBR|nr:conserved hypothetical protein [Leishmania braziliensis MHOM/BR/75/M2904]KAI5686478.1 hypothetical protein MNV84_03092 [Leishmania braziliensis]CAJ2471415.1 unnamed protein product [Leishmania braziliensis]CAJ2471990.1 unnamed protein product [Leishmania braziliensis]CAM38540.1 conserved hypothetical protein [Leishmania braziliensis MHOM/BR/75/M2904]SYZ65236.1 hypothetical_protein [Leishmania braziliensis MHOM/BR/75/M2904]
MSFCIEKQPARNSSFPTPGESYLILASSASLRKHLTDSYWCEAMEQVCAGKLEGIAVRYTGENLVMVQFRPTNLSPAGYRYPLFMSIPIEFLVPVAESAFTIPATADLQGSFGTATTSSFHSQSSSEDRSPTHGSTLPRLCVVCGRFNVPGMTHRAHGWKCKECKGTKSDNRLRKEAQKLRKRMRTHS